MKKKDQAFERARKYCEICDKITSQVIEALVSTCERCNTVFDDDGDDLME